MARDRKDELVALWEANRDENAYSEALKIYSDLVKKEPQDADAHFTYGYLLESKAYELLREASGHYEKAAALKPDWPKAHNQLIRTYAALRETRKAIDIYKKALSESPDQPWTYTYLCHAYLAADQVEEAEEVIRAGLKVGPEDPYLLSSYGLVTERKGNLEEAIEIAQRVLEIDPTFVDQRYASAFMYERLGRLEEALSQWELIVGFLHDNGWDIEAEWPESEIRRLKKKMGKE
jgi:tetratricopeptide (TPR) repeat protein